MPSAICFSLLLFFVMMADARPSVSYEVAFPNAAHHEAEVSVTFAEVPEGPLAVRMSRTSPGRYALHEFAKNVYNVRAYDGQGRSLAFTRPNPHQWDVAGHDGTVRVTYTLFGDRADGTYAGIDRTHAHLNIPATFMWARGMADAPVSVRFHRLQPDWQIATQLFPTDDPDVFTAPNLAYFIDSPTELSAFSLRTWTDGTDGQSYTFRLAVHHDGTEAEVDDYAAMAEKVVAEQIALYGEAPAFDTGTYTFIACYLPYVDGDGMEHRNSTILTSTRPLSTGALRNLGTVSHEFFHAWNVERIRPKTLEPFDLEAANMSDALWFAEGFTSYYTSLFIRRAGLIDDATYATRLSGTVNAVVNAPGRAVFSAAEMSQRAPFVDAARSVEPQNMENIFISYYTWGSGIGLALDLTLRGRYPGLTLDGYMRAAWEAYGKPEQPYALADLRQLLVGYTGDAAFADDFFDRYIEGHEAADYEALLAQAGYLLRLSNPGKAWLGASVAERDGQVVVSSRVLRGSPFYAAGIEEGDVLKRVGTLDVKAKAYIDVMLSLHRPGDMVEVVYEQRGEAHTATVTLAEDASLEVVAYETVGHEVTAAMQAFRADWLAARRSSH